ncbi:hypothetical protein GN956_G2427 [Arapaima gigas]
MLAAVKSQCACDRRHSPPVRPCSTQRMCSGVKNLSEVHVLINRKRIFLALSHTPPQRDWYMGTVAGEIECHTIGGCRQMRPAGRMSSTSSRDF